ncbi:MAG: metal-dependent phosphohydrolase [Candidatus Neomarinimicrobiota bacterium]|nr:MAG: metal-dependent phosphohydrolase [Candidatus Neomarinimicrobiota bacterium]
MGNENINSLQKEIRKLESTIKTLSSIGAALSSEHNLPRLLQMILEQARKFTNADGGTLYLVGDNKKTLLFAIVQTDSLNIRMGGTSGNPINWPPLQLYNEHGEPNHAMVSCHVALTGKTVNIPDVYYVEGFDFSGTRAFDKNTGYRSKSMLVVPMKDHEDETIGVLQLINAIDPSTGKVVPFTEADEELILCLASQAAVAINNARLIKDLENLFEAFIRVIATAIDEKSPYTGGHIERVAELTMMIARKVNEVNYPPFDKVSFTEDELKELRIAAWMHDIGKIVTPEYVVDKSTKLETIYDRINEIWWRYEVLKKEVLLKKAAEKCRALPENLLNKEVKEILKTYEEEYEFLRKCNTGGEFLKEEDKKKILEIAQRQIDLNDKKVNLLNEDEVKNLCISRGTLTDDERKIINNHVLVTIKMLSQLPYPKKLKRIPEIAGAHHEKLDGSGYPRRLKGKELSLQARILALADIFEALTAKDRPYKKAKKLSEAMRIMNFMAKDNHIDPDLFSIFVKEKIYLKYAKKHLHPWQIDEIDVNP